MTFGKHTVPSSSAFAEESRKGLSSVSVEIPADLETPVSAFIKLRHLGARFLLESVERGENVGRYSVIGIDTLARIMINGSSGTVEHCGEEVTISIDTGDDLLSLFRGLRERIPLGRIDDIPFLTGAFGYFSYEIARFFEKLPDRLPGMDLPDAYFEIPRSLVVFDHAKRKAILTTLADNRTDPAGEYEKARVRLRSIADAILAPLPDNVNDGTSSTSIPPKSILEKEEFEKMVVRAKEYITSGDIFQVVLSQRLEGHTDAEPFQIYRALRMLNPSPYMFFLDTGFSCFVGSSPEALVRLDGSAAMVKPIAGTRPRGGDPGTDARLACELLNDEKERAEHVMLVDLGRNDLGRVCTSGSVKVKEYMKVEYYSHVMHMVSTVTGDLDPDRDMFDLLRATFPAGTVSGAPKIRAMEIIEELEPVRRGPYAGCTGYFDLRGNMDVCITIRTIMIKDGKYSLQAGAGIVHDSVPEKEYRETLDKLAALGQAIVMAEEGFR